VHVQSLTSNQTSIDVCLLFAHVEQLRLLSLFVEGDQPCYLLLISQVWLWLVLP
jgi:hypothetical protein